jgi:hypothetical protein
MAFDTDSLRRVMGNEPTDGEGSTDDPDTKTGATDGSGGGLLTAMAVLGIIVYMTVRGRGGGGQNERPPWGV